METKKKKQMRIQKIDWSAPVFCVDCKKECRKPNRYYIGDPTLDTRAVYSASGRCNGCYSKFDRQRRGIVPKDFVDWSVPVVCTRCHKEMRKTSSKPDGRVRYGAYGVCINCYRVPIRRAAGMSEAKITKYDETHQECSKCNRWLEHRAFAKDLTGGTRSGLRSQCTRCLGLQSNYKMTYREYIKRLEDQNGKCMICTTDYTESSQGLVIDHDHLCCKGTRSCGKCVRGLICTDCNVSLGNFGDKISTIEEAIIYLSRPNLDFRTERTNMFGTNTDNGLRICGDCGLEKEISQYHYGIGECKRCRVLRKFNINADSYNKLLESGNNRCWICKEVEHLEISRKRLHVDHNHNCCPQSGISCGRCIRGLLCNGCNTGLGSAKDDSTILLGFINYLKRYSRNQ